MAPLAKTKRVVTVLAPLKKARFGSMDRSAGGRDARGLLAARQEMYESKSRDSAELFGSEGPGYGYGYGYEELASGNGPPSIAMSEKERSTSGSATPGRIEVLVERQVHTATVWDVERAKSQNQNQNHAL